MPKLVIVQSPAHAIRLLLELAMLDLPIAGLELAAWQLLLQSQSLVSSPLPLDWIIL